VVAATSPAGKRGRQSKDLTASAELRTPFFGLFCATLLVTLTFGGSTGQGSPSDGVAQLASVPLLALAAKKAWERGTLPRAAFLIAVGAALLPLIELVPLPPRLWTLLPGREEIAAIYSAAGVPLSWRPISVIPSATWRALGSALPAVAIFLGTLTFSRAQRLAALALVVTVGVASAPLAALQAFGGRESGFYVFDFTNTGHGVGFFANANHFGAFESCLLPLAAAILTSLKRGSRALLLAALAGILPAVLFGLALSGSRSALAMGLAALLASILAFGGAATKRLCPWGVVGVAAALALLLAPLMLDLGATAILARFTSQDIAEDARWAIARSALAGISTYFPFGSGLGTFPDVYPLHERVADLTPKFVNHAHDDLLEAAFEGGAIALALIAAFLSWLAVATHRALSVRSAQQGRHEVLSAHASRSIGEDPRESEAFAEVGRSWRIALGGAIVLWLLLLHSLWDYPLHTIALQSLFALCIGLQFAPASSSETVRPPRPRMRIPFFPA